MLLQRPGVAGQGLQAVVTVARGVAAMAALDLVGDVPEALRIAGGLGGGRRRLLERRDVSEAIGHRNTPCLMRTGAGLGPGVGVGTGGALIYNSYSSSREIGEPTSGVLKTPRRS